MVGTRTSTAPGIVLDAGALIALDRGDKRMIALLQRALTQGRALRISAGVVGQVWRNGLVQVNLARLLRSHEVVVIPLDDQLARERRDPIAQATRPTCGIWIHRPRLLPSNDLRQTTR